MQRRFNAETRSGLLLCLFILAAVAALAILPYQFRSQAVSQNGLFTRTVSDDERIPKIWDIREAKGQEENLIQLRQSNGKDASFVADVRDRIVRGEVSFKDANPTAKVEYTTDLKNAEVITPDVYRSRVQWLTQPSGAERADILRNFVKQQSDLIGVTDQQADDLVTTADYTTPGSELGWARLEQRIHGIPVFRGEINAGFTKNGEMIRAINNIAPGIDAATTSRTFNNPADAVTIAAKHISHELRPSDINRNDRTSTDLKVIFGEGDWAITAEKMYFPTELGVAVPSWRVLIWEPVSAYYVIVDAEQGTVLWHKNIADDQTQAATYQIYANPTSLINAADHATSLSPYGGASSNPSAGTQGILGTRSNVTLIGNEGPLSFNNNGWITDGTNLTDGNSNEAGVDRVAPNGVDAPMPGDTACPGAGCRTFTSTWNPPPGSPAPGDDPLTPQAQRGAVIQMFYLMNRYHDVLYQAGFTEAARNFQNTNFTGMGIANDRVSSEGQDSSGTNNANFATPADGGRGRMQMFIWTGPNPDRDGTADGDIVIHEVSHGLSNRLIGNGTGLGNQGGMMGEGWGDWYAHTMLAEPTDAVDGIYGLGGYSLFNLAAGFTANHYYGIRRFPTAIMASTGGPNNRPHNPLTFGHLNAGCDTTLGTTAAAVASAYPRSPVIATSGNCSQVHNAGEVWKSALWEVRAKFIARRGFTGGTTAVLTAVTEGMKLTPVNPNFLQARDGVILAAQALSASPQTSADAIDVREGFRIRGMGFSASVQSASAVTESFDLPNVTVTNPFSVSDSTGDNDGFPEPGEPVLLSVAITNTTGAPQTNVVGSVAGGGSANYGTVNDGQTVTRQITYTVPAMVACGALHQVSITASSDAGAQAPVMREFRVGVPVGGAPATFSNNTVVNLPSGQPATTSGPGAPYPSNIAVSGLTGNKVITVELTGLTHTFPADLDFLLVGPGGQKYIFASDSGGGGDVSNLTISFRDGAAAQPSTTQWVAGEFQPVNVGANDAFVAPAPVGPYTNAAPAGTDTFASVFGSDGTTMNGTWSLYAVDDAGGDFGTMTGWSMTFGSNDYTCSVNLTPKSRADFDGDGKTDLSVFRPSEGNWYLNRSTAGFGVINWGNSTDTIVPGDYDGDNKADTAVFRPSADPAASDYLILNSNGFVFQGFAWGSPGDVPVTGDYDGDGKTDLAVFRPSTNVWYVLNSSNGSNTVEPFGLAGDRPVSIDNDGDGKTNLAIFRPSENTWYIAKPTGTPATNFNAFPFGLAGDQLVQADYDGDNKDDIAVFRPSNGTWYIRGSLAGTTTFTPFGSSGDIAVPGDYDGDGKDDIAVYRGGTWYVQQSTAGSLIQAFGLASDVPVPLRYLPPTAGGGGGSPVTVSYTGPAVAITDNLPAGINVVVPVAGVGTITDLNFSFDGTIASADPLSTTVGLNHSWVGDLVVKLTSPGGTTVTIVDRPGFTGAGFGCNNNNFFGTTLNDDGGLPAIEIQTNPSPGPCNTALAFPVGNFSPNNPMSAFDTQNANGNWTVNISDNASGDTGSVRAFSLVFNSGN